MTKKTKPIIFVITILAILFSVCFIIIEKTTGNLMITATFGYGSELTSSTFPVDNSIQVRITGPDMYENTVILNADNNWTESVSRLKYGAYSVIEIQDLATVPGYDLNITYSDEDRIIGLSNSLPNAFIIVSNTYTKQE